MEDEEDPGWQFQHFSASSHTGGYELPQLSSHRQYGHIKRHHTHAIFHFCWKWCREELHQMGLSEKAGQSDFPAPNLMMMISLYGLNVTKKTRYQKPAPPYHNHEMRQVVCGVWLYLLCLGSCFFFVSVFVWANNIHILLSSFICCHNFVVTAEYTRCVCVRVHLKDVICSDWRLCESVKPACPCWLHSLQCHCCHIKYLVFYLKILFNQHDRHQHKEKYHHAMNFQGWSKMGFSFACTVFTKVNLNHNSRHEETFTPFNIPKKLNHLNLWADLSNQPQNNHTLIKGVFSHCFQCSEKDKQHQTPSHFHSSLQIVCWSKLLEL